MMKILLSGIGGRIGRAMYTALLKNENAQIVAGVDLFAEQKDFDVPVFKNIADVNVKADVIIDFSNPAVLNDTVAYALKNHIGVVLATTGHTAEQEKLIMDASKIVPIFKASNMSLGVNLITNLSKDAAKFLGTDYDIEIIEQHHNLKVDSPSGTAITLAKAINDVLDNRLEYVHGRHDAASRRKKTEMGIHAVRGGSVIGKHDVMFLGQGETITLSHESNSKEVFVYGALRAADYIVKKQSGFYDMNSILASFYSVTSVSSEKNTSLVSISEIDSGAFRQLLKKLNENNVSLDMISQSLTPSGKNSTSFSLCDSDNLTVEKSLAELGISYRVLKNAAKLTVEGAGMEHRSGVAMEVLSILEACNTTVYAITTSETKISLCVDSQSFAAAEIAIKKYYGIK